MRAIVPNSREQRKAALRRQDVAGLRPGVLCPFRFELLGRGNVWSYPTFPPSLTVSYLIQIPKAIRLKVDEYRALPTPPKRLCGKTCVQGPSEASLGSFPSPAQPG